MDNLSPTEEAYGELQKAYDFFNKELFSDQLPACLIIHARKGRTMGYYCPDRWQRIDGQKPIDEIAMNPQYFRNRPLSETLSTLVHEMVHLQQYHFGTPSRTGYHNKEFAVMMQAVGLQASTTGAPGGSDTGQNMSDYVIEGGVFEKAVLKIEKSGFSVSWSDPPLKIVGTKVDGEAGPKNPRQKTKWKFECPECGQKMWGKADANIICGLDMKPMTSSELEAFMKMVEE